VGLDGSDFEHLNLETVARRIQDFLEPTNHSKFASNVTVRTDNKYVITN